MKHQVSRSLSLKSCLHNPHFGIPRRIFSINIRNNSNQWGVKLLYSINNTVTESSLPSTHVATIPQLAQKLTFLSPTKKNSWLLHYLQVFSDLQEKILQLIGPLLFLHSLNLKLTQLCLKHKVLQCFLYYSIILLWVKKAITKNDNNSNKQN